MWRAFLETALLFLTPFLAYALFHLLQMRWPFVAELWHGRVVSLLAMAGLAVAIGGMVAFALNEREKGAYVPAHVENGRLMPGRFQ
jgi:hypothetical protein